MSIARTPGRVLIIPTIPALAALLSILLLFSGIVLVLATLGGVQLGHDLLHPNPFTSYEALWPGQSISSVADYAQRTEKGSISCQTATLPNEVYPGLIITSNPPYSSGYDNMTHFMCMTDSEHEFFRSMRVTLVNNRVQELVLFSDILQQDSLMLYWGVPDSITGSRGDRWMYLHWNRDTYTAVAMVVQDNTQVQLLTLTAKS